MASRPARPAPESAGAVGHAESGADARRVVPDSPDAQAKRARILDVAEDLFFERGYRGATMSELTARLGVTKPFVYYYFRDKDEIYETLCWRASHACLTAFRHEEGDRRAAVELLREGLTRLAQANIDHFKAGTFYYREPGALKPAFRRRLRALAQGFYTDLCDLLECGREEGAVHFTDTKLTALAVGSVVGFMYTWYRPEGPYDRDRMTEEIAAILGRIVGLDPAAISAFGPPGAKRPPAPLGAL